MPYIQWLADAARLTGYPVVEVGGWKTRGHGGMRVAEGVVCHHTAGPKTGNMPSLGVITNGRAGLAGPLANYGLGRDGTVYCVAAGCAWHAGASTWAGFYDLNDEFFGIEAEDDGDGIWTPAQLDSYPRLVASILFFCRRNAERTTAHRECCIPKGRKPDPAGINMSDLRNRVAWLLGDPTQRIPRFNNPTPVIPPRKVREDVTIERAILPGKDKQFMRIVCPTGSVSGWVKESYVSISCGGGFKASVAFQKNSDTDGAPPGAGPIWNVSGNNANRRWAKIPDGTEYLDVWLENVEDHGSLLVEFIPK